MDELKEPLKKELKKELKKPRKKNVMSGLGKSRVRAIRMAETYWEKLALLSKVRGTSVNGEIVKAVKRHVEGEDEK
jgi:macrodomain Ter protein organizer (MatP/YcbG family)